MSDDSIKRALAITTFGISVLFSGALFCFSIYEVYKNPDSALWLSITVGIVNLYVPSPLNLMSQYTTQPIVQPITLQAQVQKK